MPINALAPDSVNAMSMFATGPTHPPQDKNLLEQAIEEYPVLKGHKFGYSENPSIPYMESWPVGEEGEGSWKRPKNIPIDTFGVEVPANWATTKGTKSKDIAADIAFHYLDTVDPVLKKTKQDFIASMTPNQKQILQEQYQHAVKNSNEKRPFELWSEMSGIPAWLRGYMFEQWPENFTSQVYTPEQRQMFDNALKYMREPK